MRSIALCFAAISLAQPVLGDSTFDFDQFDKLDEQAKYTLVDTALKAREASLSNVDFETKSREEALHKKFEPFLDDDVAVKMRDGRVWKHLNRLQHGYATEDKWILGDQHYCREYTVVKPIGRSTQYLGETNQKYPLSDVYAEMLGIVHPGDSRIQDGKLTEIGPCAMSEWLETGWQDSPIEAAAWAAKRGATYGGAMTISSHASGARKLIDIHRNSPWFDGFMIFDYLLDPKLGYMVVRVECTQTDRSGSVNTNIVNVDSTRQIGNTDAPSAISGSGSTKSRKMFGATRTTLELLHLTINTVKPEDVADSAVVTFPPGTSVVDYIQQKAYVLLPDGSERPMPFPSGNVFSLTPSPRPKPTTLPLPGN